MRSGGAMATQHERERTFMTFLDALAGLDPSRMSPCFADDGRWELPYAPLATGRLFTGRDELDTFIDGIPEAFDFLAFTKPRIRHVEGEPTIIAEYEGRGRVTASGKDYSNRYIVVAEFQGSRFATLREYYDPRSILDAFGGMEAFRALS
jgi:uncharacterized protein